MKHLTSIALIFAACGLSGCDRPPPENNTVVVPATVAGPAGPAGQQGASGEPGRQGTPGYTGAQGEPGYTGAPGEPGVPGQPGETGDTTIVVTPPPAQ